MRTHLFRVTACLLVVVMTGSAAMGEAAEAVLNSSGDVTVNGRPSPQGTAVFAGQTIDTSTSSSAILNFHGSSVTLAPSSHAIIGPNQLDLGCGESLVKSASLGVKAGNLSVTPVQGADARYQVTQGPTGTRVAALEGAVTLNDGQVLHAGQTFAAIGAGGCAMPGNPEPASYSSKDQGGAIPAQGTSFGGAVLIGAAVVGGAAALVILTTRRNSNKCPSDQSSNPNCQ
jgi:hypothetical protein